MNMEWELPSIQKRKWIIDVLPEKKLGYADVLPERFSTELIICKLFNTTRRVADDI